MWRRYAACYALYIVLLGLAYGVFVVWQRTILLALGVLLDQYEATPVLWAVGFLAIGFALFFLILGAEPYLRAGVPRKQLRRRFARIALPLVGTIVLGIVAQEVVRALSGNR